MEIHPIAHIYTPFKEKFGIPRQGQAARLSKGKIIFEPTYRRKEAVRGLEKFDYIWLIWEFSQIKKKTVFKPVVRPPRLGGNEKIGVFASRSPFRPNRLGLSAVRLDQIEWEGDQSPVLWVSGIDMVDGTPLYDIKPYDGEADIFLEAKSGFVDTHVFEEVQVTIPEEMRDGLDGEYLEALKEILAKDPRPAYQRKQERIYGLTYGEYNVRFKASPHQIIVLSLEALNEQKDLSERTKK